MGVEPEQDPTEVSILDVLTEFWLSVIRDDSQPTLERLNASEKLAKYRLTGVTKGRKPVEEKYSTKELMALAKGYEDDEGDDGEIEASEAVSGDEGRGVSGRPRPREADPRTHPANGRAGQPE